jgi:hypothetical protein
MDTAPTATTEADAGPLLLEALAIHADPPRLVPARPERQWMNRVTGRHAYRCLPMAIANAYGWEILSPFNFEITWTGGLDKPDLMFTTDVDPVRCAEFAHSNFGHGIATFHAGYMFRTPPGWQIMTTAPMNEPKHGIGALSGVVETDWLPYPFTINWKMTKPGTVRFVRDEPVCLIYPVRTGDPERFVPVIHNLGDDQELMRQNQAWATARSEFRAYEMDRSIVPPKEAWQKFYFKGAGPDGEATPIVHQQKLRLAEPVDRRGTVPAMVLKREPKD